MNIHHIRQDKEHKNIQMIQYVNLRKSMKQLSQSKNHWKGLTYQ